MALVGYPAPFFEMPAIMPNGETQNVRLDNYRGRWLVLFFYPHDFTFVCPTEITGLSQAYDRFRELDAEILGVSTDSPHVHKAWMSQARTKEVLGKSAILWPATGPMIMPAVTWSMLKRKVQPTGDYSLSTRRVT